MHLGEVGVSPLNLGGQFCNHGFELLERKRQLRYLAASYRQHENLLWLRLWRDGFLAGVRHLFAVVVLRGRAWEDSLALLALKRMSSGLHNAIGCKALLF